MTIFQKLQPKESGIKWLDKQCAMLLDDRKIYNSILDERFKCYFIFDDSLIGARLSVEDVEKYFNIVGEGKWN